jgi:hypothetical protein
MIYTAMEQLCTFQFSTKIRCAILHWDTFELRGQWNLSMEAQQLYLRALHSFVELSNKSTHDVFLATTLLESMSDWQKGQWSETQAVTLLHISDPLVQLKYTGYLNRVVPGLLNGMQNVLQAIQTEVGIHQDAKFVHMQSQLCVNEDDRCGMLSTHCETVHDTVVFLSVGKHMAPSAACILACSQQKQLFVVWDVCETCAHVYRLLKTEHEILHTALCKWFPKSTLTLQWQE